MRASFEVTRSFDTPVWWASCRFVVTMCAGCCDGCSCVQARGPRLHSTHDWRLHFANCPRLSPPRPPPSLPSRADCAVYPCGPRALSKKLKYKRRSKTHIKYERIEDSHVPVNMQPSSGHVPPTRGAPSDPPCSDPPGRARHDRARRGPPRPARDTSAADRDPHMASVSASI